MNLVDEKNLKKIINVYDNNSSQELEKGIVISFNESDIIFQFLNCNGDDLKSVIMAALDLGTDMGYIKK